MLYTCIKYPLTGPVYIFCLQRFSSIFVPTVCAVLYLLFYFTGVPKLPESDEISEEDIRDLDRVAGLFKLSHLQTICTNILTEQDFLNPSIGTYLNDLTGANMKKIFFNQPDIADVKFNVDGKHAIMLL